MTNNFGDAPLAIGEYVVKINRSPNGVHCGKSCQYNKDAMGHTTTTCRLFGVINMQMNDGLEINACSQCDEMTLRLRKMCW
jgi:hypothetical protein